MTENVRKLVGVAAMAALVVVGVVTTSGGDGDTNFTRNAAYIKYDGFRQLPEAEQARLAPAFLEQAAPKSLDTGPINKINKEGGPIGKDAAWNFKDGKSGSDIKALSAGKASVLEGRGVDGKGGTSSFRAGTAMNGKTGKAGIVSTGGVDALSGRKAEVWRQEGNATVVADRILECASGGNEEMKERAAPSIIAIMISLFSGDVKDEGCNIANLNQKSEQLTNFDQKTNQLRVGEDEAGLLATCMESRVGGVFLKSQTEAMAADCVAIVMPALLPERAKRLGTYWQTPEQLVGTD
jgi:hypothetical protein